MTPSDVVMRVAIGDLVRAERKKKPLRKNNWPASPESRLNT